MRCRFQLGCAIIIFLVFSFFLTFPVFAQAQNPSSTSPIEEKETTGEVDFTEADKEAIGKLFRMSPQEIEALGKKLEEALNLYYDRKFGQALPIFKEIANQVETMDIMFWLGTSAMKVGETQLAIQKFKKMLEIDPKLHRARLELAVAYFTIGKHNEARRELETVKAAAPPEPVQRNIERLLAAIEERTRKVHWNIRLSEGFQWDDNVSSGPDQRELAVLGGTLTLDKESVKLRDEASITNLSGNILYDFGEREGLMWNTTGAFNYTVYFDYSQFNYMAVDVTTGPWWVGRRDIVKIPVGYTEREYGSERLSYSIHVDPGYEHYFSPYFSLRGLYSYSKEKYCATTNYALDNDTNQYEINANIYLADRRHIISGTAIYEDHNADADRFSYDAHHYGISYFARFTTATEFFFRYMWTQKDYEGVPMLYSDKRKDKRHSIMAVLSQEFFKYFFASFAYGYIDNDSNAGLYEFDRNTYTISLGCKF